MSRKACFNKRTVGKRTAPQAIPLNIWVRHVVSPFSAPFFWGAQKRGLLLPRQAAALWEGTRWCKGGTGKQKPRNCRTQEFV
jgi:hypothetical protein